MENYILTTIPGFNTDFMGDRIILRECVKSAKLYPPTDYTCHKFYKKELV